MLASRTLVVVCSSYHSFRLFIVLNILFFVVRRFFICLCFDNCRICRWWCDIYSNNFVSNFIILWYHCIAYHSPGIILVGQRKENPIPTFTWFIFTWAVHLSEMSQLNRDCGLGYMQLAIYQPDSGVLLWLGHVGHSLSPAVHDKSASYSTLSKHIPSTIIHVPCRCGVSLILAPLYKVCLTSWLCVYVKIG